MTDNDIWTSPRAFAFWFVFELPFMLGSLKEGKSITSQLGAKKMSTFFITLYEPESCAYFRDSTNFYWMF